jgi:hypothetical protein
MKQTIHLQAGQDIAGVVRAVSGLTNLVAVNVLAADADAPSLFCEENLRDLLAASPGALVVETLPLGEFKKLAREKTENVIKLVHTLRADLRIRTAAEMKEEIREFAVIAEQLSLMVSCFALQREGPETEARIAELRRCLGELASSCFEHSDNVRCMDCLQYEILPSLKILLKVFRK